MNQSNTSVDNETDDDSIQCSSSSHQKLRIKTAEILRKKDFGDIKAGPLPTSLLSHSSKKSRRESSSSVDTGDLDHSEFKHLEPTPDVNDDGLSNFKKAPASSIINKKNVSKDVQMESSATSEPMDKQPFVLHHRLFEKIGGVLKKKKKRLTSKQPTEKPRKRAKSKISETSIEVEDSCAKKLPMVELPVNAVIRGSITHLVLRKVNRLDSHCRCDDPYETPADSLDGTEKVVVETPPPVLGTPVLNNGVNVPLRVCVRSAILPERSEKVPNERHRVVILHGPQRGKTGYIVDEINGLFSVIQSDDPSLEQVVTWTVDNMAFATLDECRASKQRSKRLPPSTKEVADLEQFKLFLTCLDQELAFE